ncbi:uncharacterized protein LOC143194756 [Rhynchophorus ferrugineus]|uniref:uncharacterized protein LOC143194756 n=1 Tax=Rhynchophorus ferrugineus TaxID=354439 RepID=UPI003FCE3697
MSSGMISEVGHSPVGRLNAEDRGSELTLNCRSSPDKPLVDSLQTTVMRRRIVQCIIDKRRVNDGTYQIKFFTLKQQATYSKKKTSIFSIIHTFERRVLSETCEISMLSKWP